MCRIRLIQNINLGGRRRGLGQLHDDTVRRVDIGGDHARRDVGLLGEDGFVAVDEPDFVAPIRAPEFVAAVLVAPVIADARDEANLVRLAKF